MTLNIGLSSVSLDLLESLVSYWEITFICFDFLGLLGDGGKIFSVFPRSAYNHSLLCSLTFFFLIIHGGNFGPSNQTGTTM